MTEIIKGLMVVALQYEWWQRAIIGALIFGTIGAPVAGLVPYLWSKSSTIAVAPESIPAPAPAAIPSTAIPDIEFSGNRLKNVGTVVKGDRNLPTMSLKNNDMDGVGKVFDLAPDSKNPKK